ncbi:NADH-FMN oxidoreductase RutF, flavin reductase (DIM6/NTAB) family [Lentibacillus halodurans]|uniref:NADH-FMN oxidoreductase RutF, flavin reductase (DIM6/NTAB) family n=1 Tax=Lentibacillus halodurans TaxID=237679 RepID=A0A1I0XWS7_9BACI|nr:flavin reductase family protein [Lentibacillus halodurans]SFB05374.1 NADH-FMN oxidoreductase RutF, flavin reductase (DIM6/NTAB) family [Lentibacillus halodurans]
MTTQSTRAIKPNILYYGTPVILLTTLNADHTVNISPLSSSWGLGQYIILGMSMKGKAVENLQQHPECVINIPEHSLWKNVEKLAAYTAKNPVPKEKEIMGFSYCKNKYDISGLTPEYSTNVKPNRIKECPIQIETEVRHIRIPDYSSLFAIVETEMKQFHAHESIIKGDHHIDPGKWHPLIYNFRHYYSADKELGKTFRAET